MSSASADFPTVGIVGGGQLARMTAQPAIALGVHLRVLSAMADDSAALAIPDVHIGSHDDPDALVEFASGCDVVTFDHEHVPQDCLDKLLAAGTVLHPGPRALQFAQDKIAMRKRLSEAGLPCPEWTEITAADLSAAAEQLTSFGEKVGWPFVLKISRGGYDGRGVWVVDSLAEALTVIEQNPLGSNAGWLAEEKVAFTQELAAQVARSPHGQAVAYPVVRTVQTNGICTEVVSPAPGMTTEQSTQAQRIALQVAELLNVTGMLAVELFDTGEKIYINELAMRPHNSGHWSIDGAVTSQFENHLRAVLDLPLGSPRPLADHAVMVNVLGADRPDIYPAYRHVLARDPALHVHMYGKAVRPGRKIGHVTVVGTDLADLLARAHHAADYLAGVIDE